MHNASQYILYRQKNGSILGKGGGGVKKLIEIHVYHDGLGGEKKRSGPFPTLFKGKVLT